VDSQDLLELCARGVDLARAAGAEHAEVYAHYRDEREVGLQKNDLDLVKRSRETSYGVRVLWQGRLGFATSNNPANIAETAAAAVGLARISPPDAGNDLPEGSPIVSVDAVDPALLALEPQALATLAMDWLRRVRGADPRITIDTAGLSVEAASRAIVSSRGVHASWRSAAASCNLFGMAVDGSDVGSFYYDGGCVRRLSELAPDMETVAERFVRHSTGALGAGAGESFRGTILVPPEAVQDLIMGDLVGAIGADAVRQGRSPFTDKRGQAIAVPGFTLREGGAGLPGFALPDFDREGQRRKARDLLSAGVLQTFLYDSYEARAAGHALTGDAGGGATSLPTPAAGALSLSPGPDKLSDLLQAERAVIVTRFSGNTNAVSGDFSGVVKGGFLVRDGERRPIRETTLSGNLWACLNNITGISREQFVFGGTVAAPWLRIEDVSITAG
jgi:PmbA protein